MEIMMTLAFLICEESASKVTDDVFRFTIGKHIDK
jgi:hypothetical protein